MSLFVKRKIYRSALLIMLLLASTLTYGFQDCNDPLNPNPDLPDCDPDIYVPIDDGVYFVLFAGLVIGYQLLKRNNALNVKA